jgi:two-component system, OmpR family, response regulator
MSSTKRRILCIEAHADTCAMLSTILGLLDYQIDSAQTVAEGVSKAHSQNFDLYLLGDRYLDGTSIDLCQRIRSFDHRTPIVIYSTGTRASERQQAMRAGAQEYVSKPGDIGQLTKKISRLVENKESVETRASV